MELRIFTRRVCPACKEFVRFLDDHFPKVDKRIIVLEDIDGDPELLSEWLARTGMIQNRVPAIAFDSSSRTYNSADALQELKQYQSQEGGEGNSASSTGDAEACSSTGCSV